MLETSLLTLTNKLISNSEDRHAWISRAAAQIEQWKLEDALNGQPWGETNLREADVSNKPSASNSEEAA